MRSITADSGEIKNQNGNYRSSHSSLISEILVTPGSLQLLTSLGIPALLSRCPTTDQVKRTGVSAGDLHET